MPLDTVAPPRPSPARMSPGVIVLTITLLLALQPISTDLYLPTLPALQSALGAGIGATQLTLSALIISFGVGQLVCGPLSDRFGRRPVLLCGLSLYTLASVLCALSQSIEALVGWRALQGAALAAAVTCGRSLVRDLYPQHEGARVMSRALGGLGVVGMLAPLVGGAMAHFFDWHAALLVTAVFGAAALAFIAIKFEETVPRLNPLATRPRQVVGNWARLLAHPSFRAWTALLCCSWGGLFFVLAGSSFVFINMIGASRLEYGLVLTASSFAYICGTLLCRRLLLRHGMRGTVKRGACFSLAGGLVMGGLSLAGVDTLWAIAVPQVLYAIGHGIHQPCGQAGVVGPFPEMAGTAASLSGFAMMVTAFAIGLWLGAALDQTALPLTLGVAAFSIALATVAWTLVQRHGDPSAAWGAAAPPAEPPAEPRQPVRCR